MHAADVAETLPTTTVDDNVLAAVRKMTAARMPALLVADDKGQFVGCASTIDLLAAALPRYFLENRNLAWLVDERSADRVAARLVGVRVGDVLGECRVPVAGPDATVVELAELMVEWRSGVVLVKDGATAVGVVSAERLLELLVAAAEEPR